MSFFQSLLQENELVRHNRQPLWKYMLNDERFDNLSEEISLLDPNTIDPRDATLYYAEWWKRKYNGGKPSKEEIFNSLEGNIKLNSNANEFFDLARKGAQMLGLKWIRKQNTLYFRTLLLQGGLPLLHLSQNQGVYQNFLLAVLEEQPESIEDFMFQQDIINLLPVSSRNEIIYESCFEIVKSILNDDHIYDDLLGSNEALANISNTLKVRRRTLERKQRISKPKNYWLFNKDKTSISLRIGLADKYDVDSLSNFLGFQVAENEYQFYLNEELICVFRKLINGSYKTDWYHQQNQVWNEENNLPYTYVIVDGKKYEVNDFIQTIPSLDEPSLWVKYSDKEWRLIKGNGTPDKEAAILFPNAWNTKEDREPEIITVYSKNFSWLLFEGEMELFFGEEKRRYQSEVNSFDWTIVSQKPAWMLKANMPVVQKKPTIIVYDDNNKKLSEHKYKVWVKKHKSHSIWQELSSCPYVSAGCINLKIEQDGLVAYDIFFNIGSLQANYTNKSIDNAEMDIQNRDGFEFGLDESPILNIENQQNHYTLRVKTEYSKIPTCVKGFVGFRHQKKLYFELASPFEGMTIIDKDGRIIANDEPLSLTNLYGLRILSTPNRDTILKIGNCIKSDVVITKEIKESTQPVISFKDEIVRLYYLADAMDYDNQVYLQLLERNSGSKTYKILGFSHTLNIDQQYDNQVSLANSDDDLELFAVPLNCSSDNISAIPLVLNEGKYEIPNTETTNQFIIISSKVDNNQLMPRFVNTREGVDGIDKETRIENYHNEFSETTFEDELWKQLLSYFSICIDYDIPFSTFDQIRAVSRSSKVAARAFLFLGINHYEPDNFILKAVPTMEKDLGFCFHWINKDDWDSALAEINELYNEYIIIEIYSLISSYMQDNGLTQLWQYITGKPIKSDLISNHDINTLRAKLGIRVLNELPNYKPRIMDDYNIPIEQHEQVQLLLYSPIAVAESINDIQHGQPIWGGDDFRNIIRRNIQYSQYIAPEFYKRILLHTLTHN
jgi:hypothetical protein